MINDTKQNLIAERYTLKQKVESSAWFKANVKRLAATTSTTPHLQGRSLNWSRSCGGAAVVVVVVGYPTLLYQSI